MVSDLRYPEFYSRIAADASMPENEWAAFEATFREISVRKGELLLRQGEAADSIFIVLDGVLRNFFTSPDGREFTKVFRGPGGLLGPYSEILMNEPAKYAIQATIDSKVLRFSYRDFVSRRATSVAWEKLARIFAEKNYLEKEKRESMLIHMSIADKYEEFRQDFRAIQDLVPQYQIASYLGVSPEALNRFLKGREAEAPSSWPRA